MAQYCTNLQLDILNNNQGNNDNLDNNGELSVVSMPIAHHFCINALEVIKEHANIPSRWHRSRISNWLENRDRIDWVTNGFIMINVFPHANDENNNYVDINLTLDDLLKSSREQIFRQAFPINFVSNAGIIDYINRVPFNVVNLNRITIRIPYYVEPNSEE